MTLLANRETHLKTELGLVIIIVTAGALKKSPRNMPINKWQGSPNTDDISAHQDKEETTHSETVFDGGKLSKNSSRSHQHFTIHSFIMGPILTDNFS